MKRLAYRARMRRRYLFSRWPIANLLNRSPRTCWCDLVDWSLGDRNMNLLRCTEDNSAALWTNSTPRCRSEAAERGTCYCGKFRTAEAERAFNLSPGFLVEPNEPEARSL